MPLRRDRAQESLLVMEMHCIGFGLTRNKGGVRTSGVAP